MTEIRTTAIIFSMGDDNSNRVLAFTLAEVLITLGIIGVVAAMTIPTLIQNQQNKVLQTQLKRTYSILNQAFKLYQADNGIPIMRNNISARRLKAAIMPYLKISLDCGFGYDDTGSETACVSNNSYQTGTTDSDSYQNLNGTSPIDMQFFDDGQFVLNDGALVLIENNGLDFISVDVNGLHNKPNQLGRDLFMFEVRDNGVLTPMGAEDTYYDEETFCSDTSTSDMNGAGCTQKALYDKDYFKNL